MKKFTQLSTKYLYKNPYWDYKFDRYVLPDGSQGDYHYVETPGSVMIIPITKENKYVLTKQFRYLNQRYCIEFPGGGMKKNTSALENAINELREETGIISNNLQNIGKFNPFNGVTNEICNVYIAKELHFSESLPDKSEEFELLVYNKEEIIDLIRKNEIWDGMTLASWSLYYFSNIMELH